MIKLRDSAGGMALARKSCDVKTQLAVILSKDKKRMAIKTDLRTCKSSITNISDYVVGDGNFKNAYIILHIQMLPGRSVDIKHKTGKILLEKIHHDFSDEIKKYDTQVRVYLTETDKQHYYSVIHLVLHEAQARKSRECTWAYMTDDD